MSVFSVSSCLLEKSDGEKCYITGVLHKFMEQTNKVAVDKKGIVLDIYSNIAKDNPNIAYWINMMSMVPSNFEPVCIIPKGIIYEDLEIFIFIASNIPINPKLIVYSTSIFNDHFEFDKKNIIDYNGKRIKVLDRDKAYNHFNRKNKTKKIVIKDSIVAKGKSKIKDVNK